MSDPIAYGIDFGTTNSAISIAFKDGAEMGVADSSGAAMMPSIVYVDATHNRLAGNDAVQNFLALAGNPHRARLMASLKSFLTDRTLVKTETAWGDTYSISDLVSIALRHLKRLNDRRLGADVRRLVIGHPVLFAGAEGPNFESLQTLALERLEGAAMSAGFQEVAFLDEPTAALMGEETDEGIVVAVDFGGGTFDVSVIELTPDAGDVLAIQGAVIGGELFDSLLFDLKIAPTLGIDREYQVNAQLLPVPHAFKRMRTLSEILQMAADSKAHSAFEWAARHAGQPLRMVEEIIAGGHAYRFYRTVEDAKIALSTAEFASIEFRRPRIAVETAVTRAEFDQLLARNLQRIDAVIDSALTDAGISAGDVDIVVRTGGSSKIPGFLDLLAAKFGADKLEERDAFSTVALGLGIRACELWG